LRLLQHKNITVLFTNEDFVMAPQPHFLFPEALGQHYWRSQGSSTIQYWI